MASEGKLTRAGLAKRVADRLGYTKKDADLLVRVFFGSMAKALRAGEGVELRGFGSFRVQGRAQRMGRNPRNGQPVVVPPKTVVHFKFGKELRNGLVAGKDDGYLTAGKVVDGHQAGDGQVPGEAAYGGMADSGAAGGKVVDSHPAGGGQAPGEAAYGDQADGGTAYGGIVDGEPATGDPAYGDPADGSTADDDATGGGMTDGNPVDGHPAGGDQAPGEAAGGGMAYGGAAYGDHVDSGAAAGETVGGEPAGGGTVEGNLATSWISLGDKGWGGWGS
jgi:integration host factor subunit beta